MSNRLLTAALLVALGGCDARDPSPSPESPQDLARIVASEIWQEKLGENKPDDSPQPGDKCPDCKGKGRSGDGNGPCGSCEGTGKVLAVGEVPWPQDVVAYDDADGPVIEAPEPIPDGEHSEIMSRIERVEDGVERVRSGFHELHSDVRKLLEPPQKQAEPPTPKPATVITNRIVMHTVKDMACPWCDKWIRDEARKFKAAGYQCKLKKDTTSDGHNVPWFEIYDGKGVRYEHDGYLTKDDLDKIFKGEIDDA